MICILLNNKVCWVQIAEIDATRQRWARLVQYTCAAMTSAELCAALRLTHQEQLLQFEQIKYRGRLNLSIPLYTRDQADCGEHEGFLISAHVPAWLQPGDCFTLPITLTVSLAIHYLLLLQGINGGKLGNGSSTRS